VISETYPIERLGEILVSREAWHPYPTRDERADWEGIPESVRQAHIAKGEGCLGFRWEPFRATLFLEMARTGDRALYDSHRAAHRMALCDLVIAECIEGRNRFMDDIVDGIWALCEESFWGKPFTLSMQKAGYDLPDTSEPIVALFVAEAASLLAWTCYLLAPQIESYSKLILPRVEREMQRRMLGPCLERDDFWWMGFQSRDGESPPRVNNWNTLINSCWLNAALLMETDPERRLAAVHKSIRSLDRFIDLYPRDGGCDEGPGYWSVAGARLFDSLETLHSVTSGQIDLFDDSLIRNIGRYIANVQIHDRYFVNFADADAIISPSSSLVYRYGKRIQDPELMNMGAYFANLEDVATLGVQERLNHPANHIAREIPALLSVGELLEDDPVAPLPRDVWLPDIEIMAARDRSGTSDGFYVAAKGGHNAESHNHNDVGNCIVYIDGKPLIIDPGVGIYSIETFGPNRYDIWTMQSAWHSLPTIDGVMQAAGKCHAAREAVYTQDDAQATFSSDIADAYPDAAGVSSWKRSVTLERGKEIRIHDSYRLTRQVDEIALSLVTPCCVSFEDGRILLTENTLSDDRKSGEGKVLYDSDQMTASVEEIALEDTLLQDMWGARLNRLTLTVSHPDISGSWMLRVTR
jgi:hypothetical protein